LSFFFSSRRRHTRSDRDWSSDVCSSDLVPALRDWIGALPIRALIGINAFRFIGAWFLVIAARGELAPVFANRAGWGDIATAALRSEERRVGNECRSGRVRDV